SRTPIRASPPICWPRWLATKAPTRTERPLSVFRHGRTRPARRHASSVPKATPALPAWPFHIGRLSLRPFVPRRSSMPVFIVGFARSGTTLCQRLVSEQLGLPTLPETHFFERLDKYHPRDRYIS